MINNFFVFCFFFFNFFCLALLGSHLGFDFPGSWIHIDMAAPVHLVSYFVSQVVLRKSLRGTWELKFWVRNSFLFWSSVRQSETEVASWRMLTNATNQLDFKAIACTRLLEEQENSSLQIPIDLILIFNLISRKSGVIFPGQSPNVTMAAANSLFCRLFFRWHVREGSL